MTLVAPWRLLSRVLSGPRMSGHVREHRQAAASERMVQHHLFGRVGEMVGAAQDVRNAHVEIVDHHAEVIGGHAVGAQQNEVLELGIGKLDAAEDGILECGTPTLGDSKANRSAFTDFDSLRRFFARSDCGTRRAAHGPRRLPARAAAQVAPSCRSSSRHGRC